MSGEPWNEMMLAGAATEDREPWEPAKKPKKKGLMIGIAAAAVVIAVAAMLIFLRPSADQLLADAWEKTCEVLEARGAGQPLKAMGEVMSSESGTLSLAFSDLASGGETFNGALGLDITSDGNGNAYMLVNLAFENIKADVGYCVSDDFVGIGSSTLLGNGTLYGATPGNFTQEARGSIFDPETGGYPIDAEILAQLDEAFSGDELFDADALRTDIDQLAETYKDFVKSAEGSKRMGKVPGSGKKATVLTYVYRTEQMVGMLEQMGNIVFESQGFTSYFEYLMSLNGDFSPWDLEKEWRKVLQDLRENYQGDATITYYLTDGYVTYLQIASQSSYDGEQVNLTMDVDLGLEDGDLIAELVTDGTQSDMCFSLVSSQRTENGASVNQWELSMDEDGTQIFELSGSSQWNLTSGSLQSYLALQSEGNKLFSVDAHGTLTADETAFTLQYDDVRMRAEGEEISFALDIGYDSARNVAVPRNRINIFMLDEYEFLELVARLGENVEAISSELDAMGLGLTGDYEDPESTDRTDWDTGEGTITVPPIKEGGYIGVASCGGQEVYVPATGQVDSYDGMLSAWTDNVSDCVYVAYEGMDEEPAEARALATSYWDWMVDDESMKIVSRRDPVVSGDKAARSFVYDYMFEEEFSLRSSLVTYAEQRGGTTIITEIIIYPDGITAEERAMLEEYDQLQQMPIPAASLLP